MKLVAGPFAVAAMLAAGVVLAQQTTSPPSHQYPSSSSSSTSSSSTEGKSEKTQEMKDCLAREEANHPSMSKSDMKKACKSQLEGSKSSTSHETSSTPHQ